MVYRRANGGRRGAVLSIGDGEAGEEWGSVECGSVESMIVKGVGRGTRDGGGEK